MTSYTYITSSMGVLYIACTGKGISQIHFVEHAGESSDIPAQLLSDCAGQLEEYFAGTRLRFSLPLDLSTGTPFYREVWKLVQAIPYGRTRSYSVIAETLGRPHAVRAVGQANGRNPIAIVIPCHRVIGKNGDLTGYAYGVEMKEALLAMENPKRFACQAALW